MKTGKKIVIIGVVGVIGYLAYLYFKSKKPDTASNDSSGGFIASLPPFIQSVLPSSESNSNTSSTTSGTSTVSIDPLSTSEQKIADVVIAEIKKDENTLSEAQIKEANDYISKRALVEKLDKLRQIEKIIVSGYSYSRTSPAQRELINSVKQPSGAVFSFNSQVKAEIKRVEDILKNEYGLYPDQYGNYKI
jgi:hypothetical protein